jgi:CheY-like chemotaxis protein
MAELLKPIVLVEDNPNDLELTLVALEKARLANEVITLRDGVEAIEYLSCTGRWHGREKGNPALVILDLKLPKRDGIEVLEYIKGEEALRMTPVVMLTSSRQEPDLQHCYELGVNAYVVKPLSFNEFVRAVQDVGTFWGLINEPPPGSIKPVTSQE